MFAVGFIRKHDSAGCLVVFKLFSLFVVTSHQHSGQISCRWADWFSCNSFGILHLWEPLSSYLLLLPTNILVCNNDAVYRLQGNSYLYLQVFEDVHSTSATQIGWGTRQGVLLQVEITESYHEPDQELLVRTGSGYDCKYRNSTGRLDNLFPARSKKVNWR